MNPWQKLKCKLTTAPADWRERNLLLVALGDSVTQGLALNPRMLGTEVYHEVVRRELIARHPERTFSLVNAGVGGDNTAGALQRLQRDVLDHGPDLVFVCFGLNDCAGGPAGETDFRRNLAEIVRRISEVAAVILLTPNMMAARDNPNVDPNYKARIQEFVHRQNDGTLARYVEIIRQVAQETATPLADAYAEWTRRQSAGEDMTLWLANGINHPDTRGHRLFAEAALKVLGVALETAWCFTEKACNTGSTSSIQWGAGGTHDPASF